MSEDDDFEAVHAGKQATTSAPVLPPHMSNVWWSNQPTGCEAVQVPPVPVEKRAPPQPERLQRTLPIVSAI
jgi:hypothetical protein